MNDAIKKKVESLFEQLLIHSSEENQEIAKMDGEFGADELQAIRSKVKKLYALHCASLTPTEKA